MNFTNLRKYPRVCVFFCEYLSNAYIQYHHTHTHMEPASERASATEYLLTIVLLKFCYLHISIVCEFFRCCCWCTKGKEEEEKTFGRKSAINSRLEYISTRIGFWNAFVSFCMCVWASSKYTLKLVQWNDCWVFRKNHVCVKCAENQYEMPSSLKQQ